jgi:hypothetical protein
MHAYKTGKREENKIKNKEKTKKNLWGKPN